MKRVCTALVLAAVALVASGGVFAPAQDVITVGTGTASAGTTIDIPVFIRDTSGTPLGVDQPPGSKIQSYSIKVNYAPASAVQSISFSRAGITASLTPTFESQPTGAGTVSLLDTFQESTNPIPFTSNASLPGNQVAHLLITLSPTATPGTLTLTLDPTLTQLTDQMGSGATKETVSAGNLLLVNGSVAVTAFVPALAPWVLALLAIAVAFIAIRMRS